MLSACFVCTCFGCPFGLHGLSPNPRLFWADLGSKSAQCGLGKTISEQGEVLYSILFPALLSDACLVPKMAAGRKSRQGDFTCGQYNVPGDGKFDQTFIPSTIELEVGRVDLSDLPAFLPKTERDLLRQYLDKNHNFRHKSSPLQGET